MSKTKIEWVRGSDGSEGMSWNALRAMRTVRYGDGPPKTFSANHCEHVNRACDGCYAERTNPRLGGLPFKPGHRKEYTFVIDEKKLMEPLRRRKPTRIFVESMSDAFGEWWPVEFVDKPYAVMALTPHHTYVNLTKRPERRREYLDDPQTPKRIWAIVRSHLRTDELGLGAPDDSNVGGWPLPNVIEGTSVSRQEEADEFIPILLRTKAAVRCVSCEPLLGPIDLSGWLAHPYSQSSADLGAPCVVCGKYTSGLHHPYAAGLDWVISGGESGPSARPMHPAWARSIRDQCAAAGVAFHFKQHGEWIGRDQLGHFSPACDFSRCAWSGDSVRVGKKAAGRLLDGREHNDFPTISAAAR